MKNQNDGPSPLNEGEEAFLRDLLHGTIRDLRDAGRKSDLSRDIDLTLFDDVGLKLLPEDIAKLAGIPGESSVEAIGCSFSQVPTGGIEAVNYRTDLPESLLLPSTKDAGSEQEVPSIRAPGAAQPVVSVLKQVREGSDKMEELEEESGLETANPLHPDSLIHTVGEPSLAAPTLSEAITSEPNPEMRHGKSLNVADNYASVEEVLSVRKAFVFASHIGRPLNFFITLLYTKHDDYKPKDTTDDDYLENLEQLRARVYRSLLDAWGSIAGDVGGLHAVYAVENDVGGGMGLHLHLLAHIPEGNYAASVNRIKTILSKGYQKEINRLAKERADSLPFIRSRTTPKEKYDRLCDLRSKIKAGQSSTKNLLRFLEQREAVQPLSLPFYVEADCTEKPLDAFQALVKLRYICKSIDPETTVMVRGGETTLDDLDYAGEINLQKQSKKRFSRRNLTCTFNINHHAQAKAGFTAPIVPIDEWFIQENYIAALRAKVAAFLADWYAKAKLKAGSLGY